MLLKPHDLYAAPTVILRVSLFEPPRNRAQLLLGRRARHARFQTPYDPGAVRRALDLVVRPLLRGQQHVRRDAVELEARGHHADDRVRLAVEDERAADDARVAAEASLPELVREHGDQSSALRVVLCRQRAPALDVDAEQREEARSGERSDDAFGLARACEVYALRDEGRELLERMARRAVVPQVGHRYEVARHRLRLLVDD